MHAIVVAAGSSQRMGFDKLLAPLAGQSVLWHSIRALAKCSEVRQFTIVTRRELLEEMRGLAESASLGKGVLVVEGGAQRHLSVSAGLATLEEDGFVAIHDAARPLVTEEAVEGCLALARIHGAASCAAPVADTVKRGDAAGLVAGSVDRTGLWAMQTPQIFSNRLIREAYAQVLREQALVTDEVSAVERMGRAVAIYHNADWNLKMTFPRDLALAEMILASRGKGGGQ
jgi:2-C-methyl-D-erythritol 4-phosphate cytidylyltransferase